MKLVKTIEQKKLDKKMKKMDQKFDFYACKQGNNWVYTNEFPIVKNPAIFQSKWYQVSERFMTKEKSVWHKIYRSVARRKRLMRGEYKSQFWKSVLLKIQARFEVLQKNRQTALMMKKAAQ